MSFFWGGERPRRSPTEVFGCEFLWEGEREEGEIEGYVDKRGGQTDAKSDRHTRTEREGDREKG